MTKSQAIEVLESGEKTIAEIAEITGWPVVDDCLVPDPNTWVASDESGTRVRYPNCDSAEAAWHYAHDCDRDAWGDPDKTVFLSITSWRAGINADGEEVQIDCESHQIILDAEEPPCVERGTEHDWQSRSNGVVGHGGGVRIFDYCAKCGCGRETDTWAQNQSTGQQGLTSVGYTVGQYTNECGIKEARNG